MTITYIEKALNGIIINDESKSPLKVYEIHNKHIKMCLPWIKDDLKIQGIKYLKNELKLGLMSCNFIYNTIRDLEIYRKWNDLPIINYSISEDNEFIPEDAFLYG